MTKLEYETALKAVNALRPPPNLTISQFADDERYPVSAGTEGDPIDLATKRTTTFWTRKILMGPTPTVKDHPRIALAFNESDQRYYVAPCPHCDHRQRLVWDNMKWDEDSPEGAYLACVECDAVIRDADKLRMLARGEWVATAAPLRAVAAVLVPSGAPVSKK